MTSVMLFDPTAPRRESAAAAPHAPLKTLEGAVVGFIDNAKPNFNHLVDDLAGVLLSRYGVTRVIKRKKRSASLPAPENLVDELARECDLVITGSGD